MNKTQNHVLNQQADQEVMNCANILVMKCHNYFAQIIFLINLPFKPHNQHYNQKTNYI